jgi:hypothetical protein
MRYIQGMISEDKVGWETHCHGQIRLMTGSFGIDGLFRTKLFNREEVNISFCLHDVSKYMFM